MRVSATAPWTRLEGIVGAGHMLTRPAELQGYAVDGLEPVAAVLPGSAEEVGEVVRLAAAEKLAVIPVGGRTKLGVGAPPRRYDVAMDVTRLGRVLAYDPGDLTLGVEAGIRFRELDKVLAVEKQFVPLMPPFAERATIGGVLATNSSTPLRHAYGSARDYVLGMEFVTGEGRCAKSGGRVVKNVSGYDLHKLMIGALGTLGVITRVNFKTFPLPRAQTTFVASFAQAKEALGLCHTIAKSPLQPRLVEVVDPNAAELLRGSGGLSPARWPLGAWSVVVAAAGDERVVERHRIDLSRMAQEAHALSFLALSEQERQGLLACIREFPRHITNFTPAATLFRTTILPTRMAVLVERTRQVAEHNHLPLATLVRASGIVFCALVPPTLDGETLTRLAQAARELFHTIASSEINGRALIECGPTELKQQVNVWGPARDDLTLIERLKQAFDPQGILSPGRFLGGI
ncbi:MAG TPA: FAD-binding oxidoreductase [Candidatus Acidoferrales bacterium]|nr:FAD-binding oxidoreductase [Candidatus Acidoferrales bacterium]